MEQRERRLEGKRVKELREGRASCFKSKRTNER